MGLQVDILLWVRLFITDLEFEEQPTEPRVIRVWNGDREAKLIEDIGACVRLNEPDLHNRILSCA